MDSAKRQAAIRMARGLPWEDLEQFFSFYDKGQEDARKGDWTLFTILLVVGAGIVFLFSHELGKRNLALAICVAAAIPIILALTRSASRKRASNGLRTI